jgi:hemolysin III
MTIEAFVRPRMRGVLHAAFFPLFLAAGIVLVTLAGSARGRLAMSAYGIGLAACLGVSAVYHRGHWTARGRELLGRVDHALIFLLIAGTYTPFCLLMLSGPIAYVVLGVVWIGGLIGGSVAFLWPNAPAWAEVAPYAVVGWVIVIALPQLITALGWGGMSLLAVSGLLYTGGAVIYGRQWPDPFPRVFGYHEIFHTLVVLAAAAQCVMMFVWVLPRSGL